MIDSSYTEILYDAIQHFREHIIQSHGDDSKTAQTYIRIADDFQRYVSGKKPATSPEQVIQVCHYVICRRQKADRGCCKESACTDVSGG